MTHAAPADAGLGFARRAGCAVCVAALALVAAHTPAGLFLLPGLVLLVLLVGGRYPGEHRLSRRSPRPPRVSRTPRDSRRPRRAERRAARGGGLIAMALGGRPPPRASAAAERGGHRAPSPDPRRGGLVHRERQEASFR